MSTQRVYVVATEGRSVPMDSSSSIIRDVPVAVVLTHYYRRRIASGELELAEAPKLEPDAAPEPGKTLPEHIVAAVAEGVVSGPIQNEDQGGNPPPANPEQNPTNSRRRAAP